MNSQLPKGFITEPTNYHALESIFRAVMPESHQIKVLGRIKGERMLLATPKESGKKSVLVVSGFHGNEFSGPWGICKFLASKSKPEGLLESLNVSFLPVVNPSAFMRNTRYNEWGEEPNQGFFSDGEPLSKEGRILADNMKELVTLAKDGFLSLHESAENDKYFFYLLQKKLDEKLRKSLLETALSYFKIQPDGVYSPMAGQLDNVKGGCVHNQWDASFEHYLYTQGTPFAVTSETPMAKIELPQRINANASIISTVLEYVKGGGSKEADWMGVCTDVTK